MALINCIECKKEISDKAESCPHCGCPVEESIKVINEADCCIIIHGVMKDISKTKLKIESLSQELINIYLDIAKNFKTGKATYIDPIYFKYTLDQINNYRSIEKEIIGETGLSAIGAADLMYTVLDTGSIPRQFDGETQEQRIKDWNKQAEKLSQPHCPKCGSTAITAGTQGYTLLTGIWGSNDPVNYCTNCGHKWKPRR